MTLEEKITLGAAVITGIKWVYEYSKKMTWEKNKFLNEKYEEFKSKSSTKAMQMSLDYNSVTINWEDNQIFMDDELFYEALTLHTERNIFTPTEVSLRRMFDEYFDNLNEFKLLIDTGLISEENFRKYMSYWFDIITGKKDSKSQELREQIKKYMYKYDFKELYEFISK